MAELTRHRHASVTVESTRYVKYDELEVVAPNRRKVFDDLLRFALDKIQDAYNQMIFFGYPPEQARAVLPNCLKSELYMTANLREWRWILKLRTSKAAHPQMRELMNQVLAVFKEKLPVIVEDIEADG